MACPIESPAHAHDGVPRYAAADTVRLPVDPVERQRILDSIRARSAPPHDAPGDGAPRDARLQEAIDSLWSRVRTDSTATDSEPPPPPREFHPPRWPEAATDGHPALVSLAPDPIRPDRTAGSDIADALQYHGAFDILDEGGPGQDRPMTTWGFAGTRDEWLVDGRPAGYRRLTFPQRAEFDAGALPPYEFARGGVREDGWGLATVRLARPDDWPLTATSRFFVRMGDGGESSALGSFRQRRHDGRAIRLDFTSVRTDGRFGFDARDHRFINLAVVAPVVSDWYSLVEFDQFRDQTTILTPTRFLGLAPVRDDLASYVGATLYHSPADSTVTSNPWSLTTSYRWIKQDIRSSSNYRLEDKLREYTLAATHRRGPMRFDARAWIEDHEIDSVSGSRWRARAEAARADTLGSLRLTARLRVDDAESDPAAVGVRLNADIGGDRGSVALTVARYRTLPSLFDRDRSESVVNLASSNGIVTYTEIGDPAIEGEWTDRVAITASTADWPWNGLALRTTGHVTRIDDYLRWMETVSTTSILRREPVATDAEGYGAGLEWRQRWPDSLLQLFGGYTYKHAEDRTTGARLPDYFKHKAVLGADWTLPVAKWDLNLNLRPVVVAFRPDPAIDPVPDYGTDWVARVDAIMTVDFGALLIHFAVHNAFNYGYRTRAGYDLAGRTIRWGLDWHFLD